MLTNTKDLKGLTIWAVDGGIGTVDQVYFDDQSWAIRYLTVETGGWLGGRQVLISPISVAGFDWEAKRLQVNLTKAQVENSPDAGTHQPLSRQHEAAYLSYYGYPYYWEGPNLWGSAYFPGGVGALPPPEFTEEEIAEKISGEAADSHLRSSEEVTGYYIGAKDGEIGHVDRLIVDDQAWAIRYIEVATQNWWPGKKVLLPPAWVEKVSWEESKVFVGVTRDAIQNCEEYLDGTPITREYENQLYAHYGKPPYWPKREEPFIESDHEPIVR